MIDGIHTWRTTGTVPVETLLDARLQAHIAAHVVAGPAKVLATPQADFGHVTLIRHAESAVLTTQELVAGVRFALNISTMSLSVNSASGHDPFLLHDSSLSDAKAWVKDEIIKHYGRNSSEPIPDPKEWPHHPVAEGAPFECTGGNAYAELERYFNNASIALQPISDRENHATPVRTWPHHFDTATLVSLDPRLDPEKARSINVGFSPGDANFPGPYWYVVPYPDPKRTTMPAFSESGFWHVQGWTGAILEAAGYANVNSPHDQHGLVERFLDTAYDACRDLLEEGASG